jgi:hypothetical protein
MVNNLTEDYMNQVQNLERRIGSVTNPLDIEDVREELNLKFERLKTRGKNNSNEDDDEHALFAGGNKSRSKCNHCGKFGHKSVDCYSKGKSEKTNQGSNNGPGKFKGDCFYCKKPGHRAADCRKKKKDLETDQAATVRTATTGEDKGEIVLVTIDQGEIEEQPNKAPDQRSVSAAEMHTAPGQCDICGDKGIAGYECKICQSGPGYQRNSPRTRPMVIFLDKVAKELAIRNPERDAWMNQVDRKLRLVNYLTSLQVVNERNTLNQRLGGYHKTRFHQATRDAMELVARRQVVQDSRNSAAKAPPPQPYQPLGSCSRSNLLGFWCENCTCLYW